MILSDIESLSKICNDTIRRAVSATAELLVLHKMACQYSDGDPPPLTAASNAREVALLYMRQT